MWTERDDGSFSVEDNGQSVIFDREQAARTAEWLASRLRATSQASQHDLHDPLA